MQEVKTKLLDKVASLELAANRGKRLDTIPELQDGPGNVISSEQCKWTLKDCALFKRWINECFEAGELTAVQTGQSSEQKHQSPLPPSR